MKIITKQGNTNGFVNNLHKSQSKINVTPKYKMICSKI